MSRLRRSRLPALAATVAAVASAAPAAPASAMPADNGRDVPARSEQDGGLAGAPVRVTFVRPGGFGWPEAVLGAGAGGALIAAVVAAAERRRRPAQPADPVTLRRRVQ